MIWDKFDSDLMNKLDNIAALEKQKQQQQDIDPVYIYENALENWSTGQNVELALRQFEKAAELGYEPAQKGIAYIYRKGNKEYGVNPNHTKALKWYISLAENGDEDSLYYCASFYLNGLGTSQNLEKAFYYAEKSAATGDNDGLRLVGQFYLFGEGVVKNEKKGIECLERAARQWDIDSQIILCDFFISKEMFDVALEYLLEVEKSSIEKPPSLMEWLEKTKIKLNCY